MNEADLPRLLVAVALTGFAAYLASKRSPALVSLVIVVLVASRLARRVLDWVDHEYHSVTVISLLPLLIACTTLLALPPTLIKHRWSGMPVGLFFLLPLVYGLAMGAGRPVPAAYAFAQYLCPILLCAYVIAIRPSERQIRRVIHTIMLSAGVVAVYGIAQFLLMPEWDAFWMRSCGMNSVGKPIPLNIRVFSTMSAPGPAGRFLALAFFIALTHSRWRTPAGWLTPLSLLVTLLLTLVRSAWFTAVIALVAHAAGAAHGKRATILTTCGLLGFAAYVGLPYIPGAERVTSRLMTLGDLANDGSLHGRAELVKSVGVSVITEPTGVGLGYYGTTSALASSTHGGSIDNGFFEFPLTFGMPMAAVFFLGVYRLLERTKRRGLRHMTPAEADIVRLGRAWFLATLAALVSNNVLSGDAAIPAWVMLGFAVTMADQARTRERQAWAASTAGLTAAPPAAAAWTPVPTSDSPAVAPPTTRGTK